MQIFWGIYKCKEHRSTRFEQHCKSLKLHFISYFLAQPYSCTTFLYMYTEKKTMKTVWGKIAIYIMN